MEPGWTVMVTVAPETVALVPTMSADEPADPSTVYVPLMFWRDGVLVRLVGVRAENVDADDYGDADDDDAEHDEQQLLGTHGYAPFLR
jgi:hypothetical protein